MPDYLGQQGSNKVSSYMISGMVYKSDGSGPKIFDPGRVKFLQLWSGPVSHLWFGFEKFPLKMSNFLIFILLDQKSTLLFTAGQSSGWAHL